MTRTGQTCEEGGGGGEEEQRVREAARFGFLHLSALLLHVLAFPLLVLPTSEPHKIRNGQSKTISLDVAIDSLSFSIVRKGSTLPISCLHWRSQRLPVTYGSGISRSFMPQSWKAIGGN